MYVCNFLLASEPGGRGPQATARLANSSAEAPEKFAANADVAANKLNVATIARIFVQFTASRIPSLWVSFRCADFTCKWA